MRLADHPLAGRIWQANARSAVPRHALFDAVRRARYRLIGEAHDNPVHHEIQLAVLDALGESGLRPVVAFEQLDREHDAALQKALADRNRTAETLAEAARFNRKAWRWPYYRPLIEAALRHDMPVRAANLSRADARRVVQLGAGTFERPSMWTELHERVLREGIVEGHCRRLPDVAVPGMAAAQRARDATLARALLDPGPDGAVLFAGNGHVRRDLGVPLHLRQARPGEPILSLGLLEVEAGQTDPRHYARPSAAGIPYDYVWLTARADRDDPCKALAGRWA